MTFDQQISAQVRADKARLKLNLDDMASVDLPAWKLKSRINGTITWRASEIAAIAATLGYESPSKFVEAAETAAGQRATCHDGADT